MEPPALLVHPAMSCLDTTLCDGAVVVPPLELTD
jgi:hypothetical protein